LLTVIRVFIIDLAGLLLMIQLSLH